MKAIPLEVIQQRARDDQAKRFSAAPPKVRNAQALVALGEFRPRRFRGMGYRVPPLSFSAGARLLVVSQMLLRPSDHEGAVQAARKVMGDLYRRQRFGAWRRPRRNPFRDATAHEIAAEIDFLLDIPDETPATGDAGGTIDLMDGLLEFSRLFPAFIGPDGLPVSWAHYQYGLRHIGRVKAREQLEMASATRVAQADKKSFQEWYRELRTVSGWN